MDAEWTRIREAQRVARDRRDDERKRRDAQLQVNATAQTLRRLRRPVIDRLLERGALTDAQHRAGEEILRVWTSLTAALFVKPSRIWSGAPAGGGDGEAWPPTVTRAYRERYTPWRDEAGLRQIAFRVSVADLVFSLAVDNYGPRQIADRHGFDQRRVLDLVRNSLYRYAELAGWIERPAGPAIIRAAEIATTAGLVS